MWSVCHLVAGRGSRLHLQALFYTVVFYTCDRSWDQNTELKQSQKVSRGQRGCEVSVDLILVVAYFIVISVIVNTKRDILGSVSVEFTCSLGSCVFFGLSGFLLQPNDMNVKLIGSCKLSVKRCLFLWVSRWVNWRPFIYYKLPVGTVAW